MLDYFVYFNDEEENAYEKMQNFSSNVVCINGNGPDSSDDCYGG